MHVADCRYHMLMPPERGPWRPPRAAFALGADHCQRDITARRGALSYTAIAKLLGISKKNARKGVLVALRKLSARKSDFVDDE